MLSEATKRAREAATKFVIESQSKVGNIKFANQGVFQILPTIDITGKRLDRQIDKNKGYFNNNLFFD